MPRCCLRFCMCLRIISASLRVEHLLTCFVTDTDYGCKMTNKCVKELVDFIHVFQMLPRHVSASSCHLQGVVGVL
jgi:hypothetical protein